MKVIARTEDDDVAVVHIAQTDDGKLVEFVESTQPPYPRSVKWVLTVSTLFGCPVSCRFCDAGLEYKGPLSKEQLLYQIDYPIQRRFPEGYVPVEKFKIQFARMGEPSLNPYLLDLLEQLPGLYSAPGLIISLSTIAPVGREDFFRRLLEIKEKYYRGKFQFQFSLHTTNIESRKWLIPVRTWDMKQMAEFGEAFREDMDRKITLNFALADGMPVDPDVLLNHFSSENFLIKITPVNPTVRALENLIVSSVDDNHYCETVNKFKDAGYETILSIGEKRENLIGSNCGQYINRLKAESESIRDAYIFEPERI